MGDWLGGQQPAPNANPQAGLSTQAAAAGQPSGLNSFLSNPVFQGALSTYLGAIGSPRNEGLGHAMMQGGLSGLQAYNQAQLQQQEVPLKQAQLQEAQLKARQLGRELAPLPKDSVDALQNAESRLNQQQTLADQHRTDKGYDPNFPPPDTTEIATLRTLESQVRGNLISNDQLLTALKNIDDSKRMMEYLHATSYGQTGQFQQQFIDYMRNNVPGFPGGSIPAGGGQGQPPPTTPSGAAAPPKERVPFQGTVDGKPVWQMLWNGKMVYSTDEGKSWQPIPQATATAP